MAVSAVSISNIFGGRAQIARTCHFPNLCQDKLKLLFAVALICTIGALIAVAFGFASSGAAQGWWTVSPCIQLAQTYEFALLVAGGCVAAGGCVGVIMALRAIRERRLPEAAPQAAVQPDPIQPARRMPSRFALASTLRGVKDLCENGPLAFDERGNTTVRFEYSTFYFNGNAFSLRVNDQFHITKVKVNGERVVDIPDEWCPYIQKMTEICPPCLRGADCENIARLMRHVALPVMQTDIGNGYRGECRFDFNQHLFVYKIHKGREVVCTLTRLLHGNGDFGPIEFTGDLPEGLKSEKLFEPVDRNLESPDPFDFSEDGKEYFAWYDITTHTLWIQEQRHFNIHSQEGKFEIRFEFAQDQIPISEERLNCVMRLAELAASRADDWSLSDEEGRRICSFASANFSQGRYEFEVDGEEYFASYFPNICSLISLECKRTSDTLSVLFDPEGRLDGIELNRVPQSAFGCRILLKKWATVLRALCPKPPFRIQDWTSIRSIFNTVAHFSSQHFDLLEIPEELRESPKLNGLPQDALSNGSHALPPIRIRKLPFSDIEVVCLEGEGQRSVGLSVNREGERYFLWSYGESLFIESSESFRGRSPKQRLEITLSDYGNVKLNDKKITEVPQRYNQYIKACLPAALNLSSSCQIENGEVKVIVMPRGLKDIPRFHLNLYTSRLFEFFRINRRVPSIRAHYLNDDWSRAPGVDAGGPSQTYLSLLFDGLTQDKSLNFKKMDALGLFAPQAKPDEHEKLAAYEQMGMVLMFCYLSNADRTTGEFIHRSIFEAVFSLRDQELDEDWTRAKEARILLSLMQQEVEEKEAQHPRMAALTSKAQWRWSKRDLQEVQIFAASKREEVKNKAEAHKFLDEYFFQELSLLDLYLKQEWDQKDLATVQEICRSAEEDLPRDTAEGKRYIDDAILAPYRAQFAPIRAIAKGMRKFYNGPWNWTVQKFCRKAQGTLDRESVAESFRYEGENEIVKQKVTWLKEWVRDARTPINEIKQVLLYLSGSMGIPPGAQLEFRDGNEPHVPFRIGTCIRYVAVTPRYFPEMNDHTKEGFIAMVKGFAQGGGAFTQG